MTKFIKCFPIILFRITSLRPLPFLVFEIEKRKKTNKNLTYLLTFVVPCSIDILLHIELFYSAPKWVLNCMTREMGGIQVSGCGRFTLTHCGLIYLSGRYHFVYFSNIKRPFKRGMSTTGITNSVIYVYP